MGLGRYNLLQLNGLSATGRDRREARSLDFHDSMMEFAG
jgi:hypothetical protein